MVMADLGPYGSLSWRCVGPHRGGRSSACVGDPRNRQVFYFGTGGGGVWKTTNGGVTWENVTDGFVGTASVGALAVAPSDSNVVYLGMGECSIRGNVSYGDGVYRSTDAGATWRHLGLADTRHVARVRVHPDDPDTVYVAALGHIYGPGAERGVFRSRDGGRTWQKVLYRDEDTGCIDLVLDPTNPRVLYAALWQVRRTEWSLASGGPGSGIFKSADGGDTWTEITRAAGLPQGTLGRIGLAASPVQAGRVWALVEADEGGVYRSDDAGRTWQRLNEQRDLRSRAWYYSNIYADTEDADTVYALNNFFWKSIDGGRTFTPVATPHPDHHDLWLDPADADRMICAHDGGACVSFDGGCSWSSIYNQPTAEFYKVVTDNGHPYRLYGSQQDNTTLSVPSRSEMAGIFEREWYDVGGAESASIAVRPDTGVVFASSSGGGEGGRLTRYDHALRQKRDVSPWPARTAGMAARDYKYRFQWTSPVVLSPHDPNVLYMCGNRVFRSTDEGASWEIISPDLTRNDPDKQRPSGGPITKDHTGVEVYCTIFAFAESPLQRGLLWAGSDDGLVHVSKDGGRTWENVTPAGLPEWSRVGTIEPSPFEPGAAYLAASRHRLDDPRPYLFKTTDYGRSWTAIAAGIPTHEYTRVIRADPERRGLLYAGSEGGVYVSFDDGAFWHSLRLNLPVVPVHDLQVKDGDLVAATHGRSFWILDGGPALLRQEVPAGTVHLFQPRPTVRFRSGGHLLLPREQGYEKPVAVIELPAGASHYLKGKPGSGQAPFFLDAGQNPPNGVVVHYYLPAAPEGEVKLTFRDGRGEVIRTFTSADKETPVPAQAGANRFVWDMRYPDAVRLESPVAGERFAGGPLAVPGEYRVELEVAGSTFSQSLQILKDPRVPASQQDLQAQFDLHVQIRDKLSQVNEAINRIRAVRRQAEEWVSRGRGHAALQERADALKQRLGEVEEELIQVRVKSPQDTVNFPPKLNDRIAYLMGVVSSADFAPTRQTYDAFAELAGEADSQLDRLEGILSQEVRAFGAFVRELDLPPIAPA
jgi:photosystem II stability/assembly factor-like uncharacterized protein